MNPFIYPKCKRTVMGTGRTGIRKLRPLLDCETLRLCSLYTLTAPTGLTVVHSYILTVLLKNIFLFKCRLPTLRLTPLLTLLLLPFALTRLLCYHKRVRPPPSLFTPTLDAVILSAFPIVWFFGLLYYTDVPSLLFVILTVIAASQGQHWLASMVRSLCTFQEKVTRSYKCS
jgi:alpha-1,2-glucosyltransferase